MNLTGTDVWTLQEIYNRIKEKQQLINNNLNLISLSPILCNELDNQSPPFLTISDKHYQKCIFECTKTTIDVNKEKNSYFLCKDNSLIKIQFIIKPKDKPIKFMVKKFLNILEFCNKPISSFVVGMFVVNTEELCNLYSINENDFKFKCFLIKLSNNRAIVLSLCHEIL